MTLPESLQEIETLFRASPPGGLTTIATIIDHDEHAAVFAWYREHEWKDLRMVIRDSDGDLDKGLDWTEVGNLDSFAFHYFLPGILTGIGDYVMAQEGSEDGFDVPFCMAWLCDVVPLRKYRDKFIAEKVPAFSLKERSAVRNFLSAFASHIDERHSDEVAEVDQAIKEVWK